MVSFRGMPRNERMALAKVSGAAERVTSGVDRLLALEEKVAFLHELFDAEKVCADRRSVLLGVLLGITRANGQDWEGGLAGLYEAAGADPQAAAAQETAHRVVLSQRRGGPRH